MFKQINKQKEEEGFVLWVLCEERIKIKQIKNEEGEEKIVKRRKRCERIKNKLKNEM